MRICYLNHDMKNNTGAGRFFLSLTDAVKREKPDLSYEVLTHENALPKSIFKLPLALPKIRKAFKNCDIIHALDGWPYGFIAAVASLGLKKKLIITAIGTGAVQPLYRPLKKILMKWAYKKADVVTAVSTNTKKEILKKIPNLKIEVINHGVDFAKYQQTSTKNINQHVGIKPYILSVGAWKRRKGFEYSIPAFYEAKRKFTNLKYIIVSNAPEKVRKEHKDIIFMSELSENELISLYQNADLFMLLPQDDNKDIEGFGLVFLEAAAAGLPIISSKGTSAEDAVRDGINGILVPPQNIHEAAEAVKKIISDENLKKSMSEKSIKLAKEMSWEKAARQYIDYYH